MSRSTPRSNLRRRRKACACSTPTTARPIAPSSRSASRVSVGLRRQTSKETEEFPKMPRDNFFEETPFFTEEHARLAGVVANFAAREIEPLAHAEEDEGEVEATFRALL